MAKKIGEKSCQSNFDKRSSDFGSFLFIPIDFISPLLVANNSLFYLWHNTVITD